MNSPYNNAMRTVILNTTQLNVAKFITLTQKV